MREVLENEQFDVIFNLFTSFGYFDDESENKRMCDSISKMLVPGGRLLIDFMNAKKVIQNLVTAEEKVLEGLEFDIKRNYDGKHIYKYIQVNDNGHVSQYMERVQSLFLADFLTLLETNFEIIGTFGSYDLTSFDEDTSDRLILLAHIK
jgi:SAM-dependent methyltransferase